MEVTESARIDIQKYNIELLKDEARLLKWKKPVPNKSWTFNGPLPNVVRATLPSEPSNTLSWNNPSLLRQTVNQAYDNFSGTTTKPALFAILGKSPTLSQMLGPIFAEICLQDQGHFSSLPIHAEIKDSNPAEQFPFELKGVDFDWISSERNGSRERNTLNSVHSIPKDPYISKVNAASHTRHIHCKRKLADLKF